MSIDRDNLMQIFVYGSFDNTNPTTAVHFSKIAQFVETSEPAQIKGTCHRLKVGYPVVLEKGSDIIPGQLVGLTESVTLLSILDAFFGYIEAQPEKSIYLRKRTTVTTSSGEQLAWVYFLSPTKLPIDAKLIEGGNWQTSLNAQPIFTDRLTEKQKTYIQRLGSSSGRDIVPIDMVLYRELISLEIIVDKGRRLALSKFGTEVYRFLA